MSKTLRGYISLDSGNGSGQMSVTAFVGGKYGFSVQFTIAGKYCAMAENQVRDLRDTLTKRLRSQKGYKATEWGEPTVIAPKIAKPPNTEKLTDGFAEGKYE